MNRRRVMNWLRMMNRLRILFSEEPMQQHVKILAILHIVFGVLGLLAALIHSGGLRRHRGNDPSVDTNPDAALGGAVVGLIGAVVTIVVLLLSLPG